MSTVDIHNLNVTYTGKSGATEALRNFSLNMTDGDIYSVIGPSGSGKSTLLYVLAGVITTYTGEVLIGGSKPQPKRQSIGLVPQNYGLLPWKRVEDNIFLPGILQKNRKGASAEEILHSLNLQDLLKRYPHELSGGQQQRVALARSFIQRPELLLMDEPFSSLDAITAEKSRDVFRQVWEKNPVTTLFVTHNIEEAVSIGHKIVLLTSSPGRVVEILEGATASDIRERINNKWR